MGAQGHETAHPDTKNGTRLFHTFQTNVMRCEIDAVRLQKRGFRSVRNIARSVWFHDAAYVENGLGTCRTADRYDAATHRHRG